MSESTHKGWGRTAMALLGVGALLVSAACSDDDTDTGGGDGAEEDAPEVDLTEVLGEPNPATGEPLRLGYVYDGTTDVIDNADELEAAEATAEYVNEYLGGIGGRPIEFEVCSTDQTPSGAADCVTQMVTAEVPAVLNGVTGQALSVFPGLAEAGIAVFTPGAGDRENQTTPGIYIMGNGILSLLAGPALLAEQAGVERAAILVIDVPAASGLLETAAPLFYEQVGVEVEVVTVAPEAPDMTPNIAAAMANDVGQFAVVGDAAFCAKAMDGMTNAGFEGQISLIPHCIDDTLRESADLEGVVVSTFTNSDPESEEYQIYQAVMGTYASEGLDIAGTPMTGYQAVLGFARAMEGLTGEVTSESIKAAFAAMGPTPMPVAEGLTFQCDGQQVSIAPNFCSTDALWTTLDAEGNPTGYEVLDGAEILSLG